MNKRERQLQNNLDYIIGCYANGMSDDPDNFKALTYEQCIDLAKPEIYNIKDDGEGTTYFGVGICKDLKFLGNVKINKMIYDTAKDAGVLVE